MFCGKNIPFVLAVFSIVFSQTVFAQTYATPELRLEAEQHEAAKNAIFHPPTPAPALPLATVATAPAFDYGQLKGMYQLRRVEAVDAQGKHSATEMKKFGAEAQGEFNKQHLAIDVNKGLLYSINKGTPALYGTTHISVVDGYVMLNDCKTCQDTKFKVVSVTSAQLVLEVEPQDDGQYFTYRYTFSR